MLVAIAVMGVLVTGMVALSEYVLALPLKLIAAFGWGEIAKLYPGRDDLPARQHYFCTVRVNWMGYGSCTIVSVGDGTVNLACMFPFRSYHRPISLPIGALELYSASVRRFRLTEFKVGNTSHSVWLPSWAASEVVGSQTERH